jgi:hypothetical protein
MSTLCSCRTLPKVSGGGDVPWTEGSITVNVCAPVATEDREEQFAFRESSKRITSIAIDLAVGRGQRAARIGRVAVEYDDGQSFDFGYGTGADTQSDQMFLNGTDEYVTGVETFWKPEHLRYEWWRSREPKADDKKVHMVLDGLVSSRRTDRG